MKVGDKVTWGLDGEKVTVIEMEDCVVDTKVKIEYSDKSTAVLTLVPQPSSVVDMNDLIVIERAPTAPTPPELILEPGKEYLAFPNWRMRCISDLRMEEEGEYPVVMERYSKVKGWEGLYYYKKDGTHRYREHNIIGPWTDRQQIDWASMPKWAKAVWRCENIWKGSGEIPRWDCTVQSYTFPRYTADVFYIPIEYYPTFSGSDKDSLVVREEE